MTRSRGGMARPACARACVLLALAACLAFCAAGPLGPLPNITVTSTDLGLTEGSCSMGDVVYMPGDEFPGAGPCERCRCAGGGVRCARARCEPRAGCKALHRPDQCCPIYQCECEQEGRVYGNGEKLVDPQDPCRVCYCQGGEVVCRRIACFVRDDCRPRRVPGRCCPEYDNCPLRGVTAIPGVAPTMISTTEMSESPAPLPPKEVAKPAITIKEVTPVSEIPVLTEVKVKEVLPAPGLAVPEYPSSKAPPIVREATSEKAVMAESSIKTEAPVVIEVLPSSSSVSISSVPSELPSVPSESETVTTNDSPPSKISLSTQDSINSEIYPPIASSISTMGVSSLSPQVASVAAASKAPIVEEEDPSLLDHNPAFPPIPDDLSVVGNHDEEIVSEQNVYGEHISVAQEVATTPRAPVATEAPVLTQTTTVKEIQETTQAATVKISEMSPEPTTVNDLTTGVDTVATTGNSDQKQSPMLNLRSAIPTEILNLPSFVPEEITGELDEVTATTIAPETPGPASTGVTEKQAEKVDVKITVPIISPKTPDSEHEAFTTIGASDASTPKVSEIYSTSEAPELSTPKEAETTFYVSSSQASQELTTSVVAKSHTATEITAQTEFSSLPIETSDQNPHEISENIAKEKVTTSTEYPTVELTSSKVSSSFEPEVITVSRAVSSTVDSQTFENVETTEFILTSFGSSESATDSVELIKISGDPSKSEAIIEPERKKNNVLTDLINLVGDVASIGDQTESPYTTSHVTAGHTSIAESEELIPVNAGYKSKNSNYNLNSITEVPMKTKNQASGTKQKVIEIEDDETSITDSPPPHDKVEPTTRRPTIDNVSDGVQNNKTDQKDIEIITKSYVPTISRRPTKVVMKKSNERPIVVEESSTAGAAAASLEVATEGASGEQPAAPGDAHRTRADTTAAAATTDAARADTTPAALTGTTPAALDGTTSAALTGSIVQ